MLFYGLLLIAGIVDFRPLIWIRNKMISNYLGRTEEELQKAPLFIGSNSMQTHTQRSVQMKQTLVK